MDIYSRLEGEQMRIKLDDNWRCPTMKARSNDGSTMQWKPAYFFVCASSDAFFSHQFCVDDTGFFSFEEMRDLQFI